MAKRSRPQKSNKKLTPSKKNTSDKSTLPRGRYVVGIHSAKEVIRVRPNAVTSVFVKKGWEENKELTEVYNWAQKQNIAVKVQPVSFFSNICQTHQGLCLVVTERPKFNYDTLIAKETSIVLILDQIEDPHNLGAIMRTAWLLGVDAIFVSKRQSTPLTPTAIKVASGAAEHIPVVEETNLASLIDDLKKQSFWVYGLSQNEKDNLYNTKFTGRVCWVVGSEASGIRKPIHRACDHIISIPQTNNNASFNASVACAMALSETVRQLKIL